MPNPTIHSLLKKLAITDLPEKLNKLSLSEINSLLMEVLKTRVAKITITDVLKAYQHNRFVSPSAIDPLEFLQVEISLLKLARHHGFIAFELSPLAPL